MFLRKLLVLVAVIGSAYSTVAKTNTIFPMGKVIDTVPRPYYITNRGDLVQVNLLYSLVDHIKIDDRTFLRKDGLSEYCTGTFILRPGPKRRDVAKLYAGKIDIWYNQITIARAVDMGGGGEHYSIVNNNFAKPSSFKKTKEIDEPFKYVNHNRYDVKKFFITSGEKGSLLKYNVKNVGKLIPSSHSAHGVLEKARAFNFKSKVLTYAAFGLYAGGLAYAINEAHKSKNFGPSYAITGVGVLFIIQAFRYGDKSDALLNRAVAEYNGVLIQ